MVLDCATGTTSKVEGEPYLVGNREGVDLRIEGSPAMTGECAFSLKKDGAVLVKCDGHIFIDEKPVEERKLLPDQDYALRIGTHLCYIYGGDSISNWFASVDLNAWWVIDPDNEAIDGPYSLDRT